MDNYIESYNNKDFSNVQYDTIPVEENQTESSDVSNDLIITQQADVIVSKSQPIEDVQKEKLGYIKKIRDNIQTFFTKDPRRSVLLVGLVLAGCTPQNTINDSSSSVKTEVPIINPKPTSTPQNTGIETTPNKDGFYTVQPTLTAEVEEVSMPIVIPTEDLEAEKKFDYSTLNLIEWESYEVSDIEKLENGHIVQTNRPTMLYATPWLDLALQTENTTWAGVKEMKIKEDFMFEIAEKRTITDTDGKSVTIGRVRYSFALEHQDSVISIIMSAKDKNGVEIDFVKEDVSQNKESCATVGEFIGMIPSSALKSVLLASRNFLKYQEENGPFKSGQEYSFSDITQFYPNDNKSEFFPYTVSMGYGRTDNHVEEFATAMAYMLYGSKEPMAERTSSLPKSGYTFLGPDISIDNYLDYKVLLSKIDGVGETPDFVFRMKEGVSDRYIKLSIDFTDNQLPEGINVVQEPVFVYSMCTTDKPIVGESEKFDKLYNDFLEYEKKRLEEGYTRIEPENFRRYVLEGEDDAKVRELINAIYKPVPWEGK